MNRRQATAEQLEEPLYGELLERVETLYAQRDAVAPALRAFAAEISAGRFRKQLTEIADLLERDAGADALLSRPERLDALLPLVARDQRPGEAGAALHDALSQSQRRESAGRQRLRVLAYPLAVTLILLPVLVFLLTTIVPVYSSIFASFELELPTLTRTIVWMSERVIAAPLLFVPTVFAAVAAIYACYLGLGKFSHWYRAAFGYVVDGSSRELVAMGTYIRRLRGGLAAGLPAPLAVDLAGQMSERRSLRDAAAQLARGVDSDLPLVDSPVAERFPAMLLFALDRIRSDPSRTAGTQRLLDTLSETYLEQVADRTDWNTGAGGQLAIVAVGVMVGIVVIAMLLPLVHLVNGLGGF